jgi:hypothetical protein
VTAIPLAMGRTIQIRDAPDEVHATLRGRAAAAGHMSEDLDVPLVTCDRRLAATPGHRARVELFGPGG